jgi:hypothetical protein
VPKDLHRVTRVHVEGSQQRAAGLAGAVHSDRRDLRSSDAAGEAAVEVPWLNRDAVPGREDETCFDPSLADAGTVGVLLLPAQLESRDAKAGERRGASDVSV